MLPSLDLTRERLYVSSAESGRTRIRRVGECRGRREEWVREVPHGRTGEMLAAEWSPTCARLLDRVRGLAARLRGGRVLLWGVGVGTFVYPFDEAACAVVVVERFGVVSDVLRTRLDIDGIAHEYDRPGAALRGVFDGVVAFSLAQERGELVGEFRRVLRPGGLLVASQYDFDDTSRAARVTANRAIDRAWPAPPARAA